jgi:hypothetical protein
MRPLSSRKTLEPRQPGPARSATFGIAAVVAISVVLAVHLLDFPGSVPRFEAESGGGVLLDTSPAFTVDDTYQRLAGYGEVGRRSYAGRNMTIDVLLPLSLLPFLYLLMKRAVRPLQLNRTVRFLLLAVPFAYVFFDLMENALVLILLDNFPRQVRGVAVSLPFVTVVKRLASLVAIFGPLAIFGFRLLQRRFRPAIVA